MFFHATLHSRRSLAVTNSEPQSMVSITREFSPVVRFTMVVVRTTLVEAPATMPTGVTKLKILPLLLQSAFSATARK